MRATVQVAVVHVAGPIGGGKSSLLARADRDPVGFLTALGSLAEFGWVRELPAQTLAVATVPEVPANWKTADGASLLELMYADPARHAYAFQKAVLAERYRSLVRTLCDSLIRAPANLTHLLLVTESSVDIDYGVFARASHEAGFISETQYYLLDEVYSSLGARQIERLACASGVEISLAVRGTLYLCTPLAETVRRIKERGRACEQALPSSYLDNVIDRHALLLSSGDYPARPVVAICDTPPDAQAPFVGCSPADGRLHLAQQQQ